MNATAEAMQTTLKTVSCPYCHKDTSIDMPENYAPVYSICEACGKKFIIERRAIGFQLMTLEDAPCISDPDCRDIEMGGGDEE